jgi:Protein of unknown function (DUF1579)
MRAVLASVLVLLVAAACESSPAGQPRKPPQAVRPPEADLEQQVSAQEAASQPGPMHKKIEPLIGDWQTSVTRIAPNGTEVPGGSGVTRVRSLFGGRYQRWDAVMDIGGKSRETTGWLGYDRNVQEYQLSMITSFSSGMGIYRGQGDLAKDGIVFLFEQVDPRTGAHLRSRNRLKLVTNDYFVIEDVDEDLIAHARSHYRRVK